MYSALSKLSTEANLDNRGSEVENEKAEEQWSALVLSYTIAIEVHAVVIR